MTHDLHESLDWSGLVVLDAEECYQRLRNEPVGRRAADGHLLQVSSAFGRAMESVDRVAMSKSLFPVLAARMASGVNERSLRNAVAASAEGYAFPTNLDRDQPVGGLAPESQAALVWRGLREGWEVETLGKELDAQQHRHSMA